MRICYIATPNVHTNRWMQYFARRGHEVHLITTSPLPDGGIEGVNLHQLKKLGSNYLINSMLLLKQFGNLIKQIKPDVLHGHQVMDSTLLGIISGFHPFVVSPWGSDVLVMPKKSALSLIRVKYILSKADLITCDAEHIQQPLIKLGANAERIKLIYFGTDAKKFTPTLRDEKLRKEIGTPIIVSCRHLEPVYDVRTFIIAIPPVLKKFPQVKFLVISDGSEKDELVAIAKHLGVSDNVKFLGRVSENELARYLASSDIYVSTSFSDAGLASSTAEAMACGLPVVITNFGDNDKWVKDGVNGFLIPFYSPYILASRIIQLLESEADRKRFGQLNRWMIVEKKDNDKEMAKMGGLYEQLVGEHGKR